MVLARSSRYGLEVEVKGQLDFILFLMLARLSMIFSFVLVTRVSMSFFGFLISYYDHCFSILMVYFYYS